jgi:hypothetical protein
LALDVTVTPEAILIAEPPNEAALLIVMLWLTLIVPQLGDKGGTVPVFQFAAVVQAPLAMEV